MTYIVEVKDKAGNVERKEYEALWAEVQSLIDRAQKNPPRS